MLPDDLCSIFVWFQFPKNDLMVVLAYRDKTCVVIEPVDLADRARVRREHAVRDPAVLPEAVDLHTVVIIVECVHVATIGELNLRAPAHIQVLEVRRRYIIRVHRVNLDSVQVADYEVETGRVERHCLDHVGQRLDCLQIKLPRV